MSCAYVCMQIISANAPWESVIFAIIVAAIALTQIAPQIIQITKAAAAAQDLFQVIDRRPEIDSLSEEGLKPDEVSGSIELKGVHFAYPTRDNVPIFSGLDLSIPERKTTALVGASGSGKSTIVGLVERWYSINKGSILLDGIDIRDLNIKWLRNNIRLVEQVGLQNTYTRLREGSLGGLTWCNAGTYPVHRYYI